MNKFRIKGVGLDTTHIDYFLTGDEGGFNYLYIPLSSNNSCFLSNYLKTNQETQLIISTDFLDNIETALYGCLSNLGRESIDLFLIDSKCDIEKYKDAVLGLISAGYIKNVGIKDPEQKEDIEKFEKELNYIIKYCSLDLCPLNFNYDLISWCIDNKSLLGFNPFGGYLSAPSIITSFTVPYLLEFSAFYSEIVFLSSKDINKSIEEKDYLESLYNIKTENKYELKKSISKLIKPIKKAVETSLIVDSDLTLPYNNPESLFNHNEIKLSFGKLNIERSERDLDEVESLVSSLYSKLHKPEDITKDEDFISIILPKIVSILKLEFPESNIGIAKISNNVFVIIESKEIIEKKVLSYKSRIESNYYVLYYQNDKFIFQKIQNSSDKTLES